MSYVRHEPGAPRGRRRRPARACWEHAPRIAHRDANPGKLLETGVVDGDRDANQTFDRALLQTQQVACPGRENVRLVAGAYVASGRLAWYTPRARNPLRTPGLRLSL